MPHHHLASPLAPSLTCPPLHLHHLATLPERVLCDVHGEECLQQRLLDSLTRATPHCGSHLHCATPSRVVDAIATRHHASQALDHTDMAMHIREQMREVVARHEAAMASTKVGWTDSEVTEVEEVDAWWDGSKDRARGLDVPSQCPACCAC